MVDRFVTQPIVLSPALRAGRYSRVTVVLHGVDHSKASYEGRLYLNDPDADSQTGREQPSYIGSYHVLGHGECFGDVGHRDIPTGPRAPFDPRPAHQLTPHSKAVIVTDPLTRILASEPTLESITITIVAVATGAAENTLLAIRELRLLSYR
jgi:hypothetical protein